MFKQKGMNYVLHGYVWVNNKPSHALFRQYSLICCVQRFTQHSIFLLLG